MSEKVFISLDNLSTFKDKMDQVVGGKQDTLISGTTIKTIGGQSILGAGDVSVIPNTATTEDIDDLFLHIPEVGDIITINSKRFRVLKFVGKTTVKLLAMEDYAQSAFGVGDTVSFDGGYIGQSYANSTLDALLNTTYYNSLPSIIRNAIVSTERAQKIYNIHSPAEQGDDYTFEINSSGTTINGLQVIDHLSIGNRKVSALTIDDIYEYTGDTELSVSELNTMLFETAELTNSNVLLMDVYGLDAANVLHVAGSVGGFVSQPYSVIAGARPVFVIDLANISWN